MSSRAIGPTPVAASLLLLLATVAACGGGGGDTHATNGAAATKSATTTPCDSSGTTPVGVAVTDFIKTATPPPQRYLTAAGTDSELPPEGLKAVQDKGPTYFYGGDSAAVKKLLAKLALAGPYASMLVIFRGASASDAGRTVTVKLAGQYVGGAQDGTKSPLKTYVMKCDSTMWKVSTSAVASGS